MNAQINFYQAKLAYEMDPADLFSALENNEAIIPIDCRSKEAYEKEHIPFSINIPHREMTHESTRHLDKSKLYVCYCDGIGCNASTKGALNMSKLGFKTKELIGGIEWWKFDKYSTEGRNGQKGDDIVCAC